jgi:hypothetical protein
MEELLECEEEPERALESAASLETGEAALTEAATSAEKPNEPSELQSTMAPTESPTRVPLEEEPEPDPDMQDAREAEQPRNAAEINVAEIAELHTGEQGRLQTAEQKQAEQEKPEEAAPTEAAKESDKPESTHAESEADLVMLDVQDAAEQPRNDAESAESAESAENAEQGHSASAQPQQELSQPPRVATLEEKNAALQNAALVAAENTALLNARIAELEQQARVAEAAAAAAALRRPRPRAQAAPRPKLSIVADSGSGGVEKPKTKKRGFHDGSVACNTYAAVHGRSYKERQMGGVPLRARVQARTFGTTYLGRRTGSGPLIPFAPERKGKNLFVDIAVFLEDRDDGETHRNKLRRYAVFCDTYNDWKRDPVTKEMVEVPCLRPEFNVTAEALFDFSVSGSNGGVHEGRMRAIKSAGTTIGPLGDAALSAYSPSYDELARTAQWRKAPPPKKLKTTKTKSAFASDSDGDL